MKIQSEKCNHHTEAVKLPYDSPSGGLPDGYTLSLMFLLGEYISTYKGFITRICLYTLWSLCKAVVVVPSCLILELRSRRQMIVKERWMESEGEQRQTGTQRHELGPHENSLKLVSVLVSSDSMGCPAKGGALDHRAKHICLKWKSEKLKKGPRESRAVMDLSHKVCELQNDCCLPSALHISHCKFVAHLNQKNIGNGILGNVV